AEGNMAEAGPERYTGPHQISEVDIFDAFASASIVAVPAAPVGFPTVPIEIVNGLGNLRFEYGAMCPLQTRVRSIMSIAGCATDAARPLKCCAGLRAAAIRARGKCKRMGAPQCAFRSGGNRCDGARRISSAERRADYLFRDAVEMPFVAAVTTWLRATWQRGLRSLARGALRQYVSDQGPGGRAVPCIATPCPTAAAAVGKLPEAARERSFVKMANRTSWELLRAQGIGRGAFIQVKGGLKIIAGLADDGARLEYSFCPKEADVYNECLSFLPVSTVADALKKKVKPCVQKWNEAKANMESQVVGFVPRGCFEQNGFAIEVDRKCSVVNAVEYKKLFNRVTRLRDVRWPPTLQSPKEKGGGLEQMMDTDKHYYKDQAADVVQWKWSEMQGERRAAKSVDFQTTLAREDGGSPGAAEWILDTQKVYTFDSFSNKLLEGIEVPAASRGAGANPEGGDSEGLDDADSLITPRGGDEDEQNSGGDAEVPSSGAGRSAVTTPASTFARARKANSAAGCSSARSAAPSRRSSGTAVPCVHGVPIEMPFSQCVDPKAEGAASVMSVAGPPANAKDWDAADRWISKLSIWVAMAKGKLGVQVHRASEAMKKWTQAEGDKVDKERVAALEAVAAVTKIPSMVLVKVLRIHFREFAKAVNNNESALSLLAMVWPLPFSDEAAMELKVTEWESNTLFMKGFFLDLAHEGEGKADMVHAVCGYFDDYTKKASECSDLNSDEADLLCELATVADALRALLDPSRVFDEEGGDNLMQGVVSLKSPQKVQSVLSSVSVAVAECSFYNVMVEATLASLRDGAASEGLVRATHGMLEEAAHALPTHAGIPKWKAGVSKGISDASRATAIGTAVKSFPEPIVDGLSRVVSELQSATSKVDISGRDDWFPRLVQARSLKQTLTTLRADCQNSDGFDPVAALAKSTEVVSIQLLHDELLKFDHYLRNRPSLTLEPTPWDVDPILKAIAPVTDEADAMLQAIGGAAAIRAKTAVDPKMESLRDFMNGMSGGAQWLDGLGEKKRHSWKDVQAHGANTIMKEPRVAKMRKELEELEKAVADYKGIGERYNVKMDKTWLDDAENVIRCCWISHVMGLLFTAFKTATDKTALREKCAKHLALLNRPGGKDIGRTLLPKAVHVRAEPALLFKVQPPWHSLDKCPQIQPLPAIKAILTRWLLSQAF
ncbi:unnamed protein product, partial [Prorocentrum cordatum]